MQLFDLLITYLTLSLYFIILFGITYYFSTMVTEKLIKVLPSCGFKTCPLRAHVNNKTTVPLSGGLGVISVFLLTYGATNIFTVYCSDFIPYYVDIYKAMSVFPAIVLIMILGMLDDRWLINPKIKFAAQITIATLCWRAGFNFDTIFGMEISSFTSYIFTVIWILTSVNIFSLLDGLEGFTAGLAALVSTSLVLIFIYDGRYGLIVLLFCLLGSLVGFLKYNLQPSKILLGRSGSMPLGLLFALIGIHSASASATFNAVLVPILALVIPFFDVSLEIFRSLAIRWLKKTRGYKNSHSAVLAILFNEMVKSSRFVKIIFVIFIFLSVISLTVMFLNDRHRAAAYILIFMVLYSVVHSLGDIIFKKSNRVQDSGIQKINYETFISTIFPIFDLGIMAIIFTAINVTFLGLLPTDTHVQTLLWSESILIHCLAPISILILHGSYKQNWLTITGKAYLHYIANFTVGFVLSFTFCCISGIDSMFLFMVQEIIFFSLVLITTVSYRAILHFVHLKNIAKGTTFSAKQLPTQKKIVILGKSNSVNLATPLICDKMKSHDVFFIGCIVEDINMIGGDICKLKVIGHYQNLAAAYAKYSFAQLIIIDDGLTLGYSSEIITFCQDYDIKLMKWFTTIEII